MPSPEWLRLKRHTIANASRALEPLECHPGESGDWYNPLEPAPVSCLPSSTLTPWQACITTPLPYPGNRFLPVGLER